MVKEGRYHCTSSMMHFIVVRVRGKNRFWCTCFFVVVEPAQGTRYPTKSPTVGFPRMTCLLGTRSRQVYRPKCFEFLIRTGNTTDGAGAFAFKRTSADVCILIPLLRPVPL
jgi:hypothetical protein